MLARFTFLGRCLLVVFLLYWVALFVGTHLPNLKPPRAVQVNDKIVHFVGYAGLAFLAACVTYGRTRVQVSHFVALLLVIFSYGVLDELLQIPIPGRSAELFDWLADITGAASGVVAFVVLQKFIRAPKGETATNETGGGNAIAEPRADAENATGG